MTTFVKIIVDESIPQGSFKIEPVTRIIAADDMAGLASAIANPQKVARCPTRDAGERLRRAIEKSDGLEEIK